MAGFDTEGPGGAAAPEEKSKTRGKKIDYYDYDPVSTLPYFLNMILS